MKRSSLGFTLIEILVTIAVITILASILYVNFGGSTAQARDSQRKADLRELQTAVELYKNRYGRYPAGCRAPGTWSGLSSDYACPPGQQYIVGLAPEFIPALPVDPKPNGNDSGYVYTTNTAGTVYKIMARRTVETEVVNYSNEFKSCDATNLAWTSCANTVVPPSNATQAALDRCDAGVCDRTLVHGNNKPGHCQVNNSLFRTTYAVWGGVANPSIPTPINIERETERVICDLP